MSAILLDGSIVHYEVLGRGRPVIFLHGWVGSWKYWIASMQVTSTSYRAYAIDLWGFGDTAHNQSKYSITEQANLLDSFLKEMGIGKIALIGHGLGALVGMKFAALPQNAGRVDRLMAVGCPISFRDINSRLWTSAPQDLSDARTPEAATALSDVSKADKKAIEESKNELQADTLFGEFRSKNISCLFVSGEKDQLVTAQPDDKVISTYTHQISLEASGHFPMIDETIKFNRLLTDFLSLDSGMPPNELQMKEEWKRRMR